MLKIIPLLLLILMSGCSSIHLTESSDKAFLENKVLKFMGNNKSNTFNTCNAFLIKPDEVITAFHCFDNLSLSFILKDNSVHTFEKILDSNESVDFVHLKLKKPLTNTTEKDSFFNIDHDSINFDTFYIGINFNDKLTLIKCYQLTDTEVLLAHGKCENPILKGYSGAVILNSSKQAIGVLIGVSKTDPNVVFFTQI